MRRGKRCAIVLAGMLAAGMTASGHAFEMLSGNLDLNCSQTDTYMLACSYRLLGGERHTSLTAMLDGTTLPVPTDIPYPTRDSISAVLFLIDTSDPGRQAVIDKNADQIAMMLEAADPHHRAGLASFDKELVFNAPVGSDPGMLIAAAQSLQAAGMTTELYRNVIEAIESLAVVNADRKAIFLFSDGQAEDQAYFHEDAVRAARQYGVMINSLGYPRSTVLSVALQTLRRLSEETGGIYVESDGNYDLPRTFLDDPYANVDKGGHFIIDLNDARATAGGDPRLGVRFETASAILPVSIPVRLPAPPAPASAPGTMPVAAAGPPPAPIPGTGPAYDPLLWYGVPLALVVLIVLTLISLFLLYRRQQADTAVQSAAPAGAGLARPLAYLITQDEKGRRYPVTSATWRIGRSRDNELTINDSSISRRHAEIQRDSHGNFHILDRDSTNGVFVNNRKINRHKLAEGDIIEIGDLYLRFTQNPLDYQLGESTMALRTRAPV